MTGSGNNKATSGKWWTPDGFIEGVCHHDSIVQSVVEETVQTNGAMYLPAPVDLHVHGGGGYDCMDGDKAVRGMLAAHAQHGTGAMLATSVTAPYDDISRFIKSVARVMQSPDKSSARLLGVHLEGPFISPQKLGAQPPYSSDVNIEQLESWLASGIVRVMTFAPEIDPHGDMLALCQRNSVRAQIGHTNCTWSEAHAALLAGCGMTHLFNAMSGVSHRDGGAATAALAYAEYAEIILDGFHVEKAAFDAARRAIPKLYSVTDATAAAGMPDGNYKLGSYDVCKRNDQVLLADGTLAGSCLTQRRVISQLRYWDIDWHTIGLMISTIPAQWIDEQKLGVIEAGAEANWLEIQNETPVALWLSGVRTELPQDE